MEQYINYVLKRESQLIFNSRYEEEVIKEILGGTDVYQKQLEKINHLGEHEVLPAEWVDREDIYLANFSFNMFIRSKKIMASELSFEEFKALWENYILTSDYYIQVANYMLNSDDYLSGERYKLKVSDKNPSKTHKSNLIQNMKKLQASFQGHPEKESQYVQKVGQIGIELSYLIQK